MPTASSTDLSYPDPDLRVGPRTLADILTEVITILVVVFLSISTFEGAFRFYAAKAGFVWLVYLKDVSLIGALTLGCVNTFLTDLRNLSFWTVLTFLTLGTIIGCLILPDIRQPLFAAKTWLPLICGTSVASSLDPRSIKFRRACWLLWAMTVGGVFLTARWHAPWVGYVYEVGGVAIEGSREWSIGDVDRVAGFSRASFDAALQCLFFASVIISSVRSYLFCLIIWALSGVAIYVTTSRSALVAIFVAIGLHFLVRTFRSTQWLSKIAVATLAVIVLVLPFAAALYYQNKASLYDASSVASTSSFQERATKTWPDGFALTKRGGSWIWGRGLGGIGVAQQVFEPAIFNPGDNFFVYVWGAFGAMGFIFYALIPLQAWRAMISFNESRQTGIIIAGTFLAVGLTLNAIEAATASLFLGLALVWLSDRRTVDETAS